jgi:phytoene dehydrogenase-like protein
MRLLVFLCLVASSDSFLRPTHTISTTLRATPLSLTFLSDDLVDDAEVVVVGSGLAGLSCAALLAHTGHKVTVVESHDAVGGCAHGWERAGYHFESGPSLYSGLSVSPSPNPLKNIFQIIGEEPEWITYDRWGTALPEGKFAAKIGPEGFDEVLEKYGGAGAKEDWAKIINRITAPGGLAEAAQSIPSLALREDLGAVWTLGKYWRELIATLKYGKELQDSFSTIRDELNITNKFVLNWLDMLCFLLQGLPAEGTLNAVIAYMLADWYRPGVLLDFPRGGSSAIVDALVRGIRKNGGRVVTNSHVEEVHVEGGVAVGVTLRNRSQERVRLSASKAVVSNVDMWASRKLVPKGAHDKFDAYMDSMLSDTPKLASFIHLHAGIDAYGTYFI